MAGLATESAPAETSRAISIRFPIDLHRRLETIAQDESNSVSSTVRRLVSAALRAEQQEATGR